MTFYADLSPCGYFEADVDFMAIGWLEADHGFTKGPVSDEFRMALANFIPFSRWFFCGLHQCSLCHDAYGGVGGFVPSENRLFAFPELLAHYVEIHGYQPPAPRGEVGIHTEAVVRRKQTRWAPELRKFRSRSEGLHRAKTLEPCAVSEIPL